MNPLVSVIIPAYNAENYIEKAIQSVLEQTYPNFEVIVIDDNSTDRTVDVVREFRDERIKLLVNEQNMGPSYSRNRGIIEAKGEWIALLDSDDWWDKDRIGSLIKVVKQFSPDIIADDIKIVWESIPGNFKVSTSILKQRGLEELNRFISIVEFIEYDFGIMQPMIKRRIFESILYRNDMRFVEDFDLYLRALLKNYKWYQLNGQVQFCL
jgi:succinoglycan biosynthesis protein ExoO